MKIHRYKPPFEAYVREKRKSMECIPAICNDMFFCGTGVMHNDHTGIFSVAEERNIVAAWRGTHIIRFFDTVDTNTLCAAYYTAMRGFPAEFAEKYVHPTIRKLGMKNYRKVMSIKIPREIIEMVMRGQLEENAPPISQLEKEVFAGTVDKKELLKE